MTRFLVVLVVAFVFAGCAASPDGPSGVGGTPPLDRAGAPVIAEPRDLAPRAANPCSSLLSEALVRRLGYDTPGTARTTMAGSSACTWREGDVGRRIDVSVALDGDLFVDSYRRRVLPVFRPLEIGGLPAVDLQSGPDAPTCTTTVGVADGESLDVSALAAIGRGGRPASDPCDEGHRVAEAIVSTLPPKRR